MGRFRTRVSQEAKALRLPIHQPPDRWLSTTQTDSSNPLYGAAPPPRPLCRRLFRLDCGTGSGRRVGRQRPSWSRPRGSAMRAPLSPCPWRSRAELWSCPTAGTYLNGAHAGSLVHLLHRVPALSCALTFTAQVPGPKKCALCRVKDRPSPTPHLSQQSLDQSPGNRWQLGAKCLRLFLILSLVPLPPSAALQNDLQAFDSGGLRWTDLSSPAHGAPPPPRGAHGVAASAGGVFVFGGSGACPAGDGCLGA